MRHELRPLVLWDPQDDVHEALRDQSGEVGSVGTASGDPLLHHVHDGAVQASVLRMTAAYAAVANGGYRVQPTGVLAVVDGRGQVRASFLETPRSRVIPEKCIPPTRAVLNDVVQSGTGRSARLERWRAYGKTGTTTGNADAWFIGWSEGRVLGIWMGKRRDAPGGPLAGAGAPADLFRRVATSANEMVEHRTSDRRQKVKPGVTAQRPRPALTRIPERKLAQAKEAARV